MSEQSTGWEAPTPKPIQSTEQMLDRHYAGRENPDDINDMVSLAGEGVALLEASAEQVEPGKYEALASDMIDVANNSNPMQRKVLMGQFLGLVMSDAEAGNVKSSKGDAYTTEAVRKQLQKLYQGLTQPVNGEDPLKYLARSEGLRNTFTALLSEQSTADPLMRVLQERLSRPLASPEMRSPDAIAEVGGKVVENAGVMKPIVESAEVQDPFSALPQEVQDEINQYRQLAEFKKQSERDKDFAQAAEDGRSKYAFQQRMSRQARAFLGLLDQ